MATRTFTNGGVNDFASTAGNWNTAPVDNDTIVISAGSNCCWDVNTSGWANGIAGFTITSHATTPAMVYFKTSGTANHIKIKTGTTLNGTNAAVKGRLLANADGVWANSVSYPFAAKAAIEFITTAYLDGTYLNVKLLCAEPTNKVINFSADAAVGQTELSVATDITGDIWADGDTVAICDLQQAKEVETRVIAAGGRAAGTITVTAGLTASKIAGTYPAVMILCTRNIKLIGGSGASQNMISALTGGTVNAWCYCATADQGYGMASCTGVTISGGCWGRGPTTGWTAGWSRVLSSCTSPTISGGTITGNNYSLSSCTSLTISGGTITGNTYGLYSCTSPTISGGSIAGNTFGLSSCSGVVISGSSFSANTIADLHIAATASLYNTILGSTTEVSQYNNNNVPAWSYIESYDHDQVANAFKSWTRGGISISDTTPANLPTGYASVYKHTCEDVTMQNFRQNAVMLLPGQTLKVDGQIRIADDHSAWAPRLEIIAASADPLWGGGAAVLATVSVATPGGSGSFQAVSVSYTNTSTRVMKVYVRVSAKRASGDMYENWSIDVNYPAATNVRTGTTYGYMGTTLTGTCNVPAAADVQDGVAVDATTGTFEAPAATDVRTGVGYGAAGTEFTGTCNVPVAADVQDGVAVDATTGTFEAPSAADVRTGTGYGAAGTEFTGTCNVPVAVDVQDGVAVDATTGTFEAPATADVRDGVGYGNASEYAGTLVVNDNDYRVVLTWDYGVYDLRYMVGAVPVSGGNVALFGTAEYRAGKNGPEYIKCQTSTDALGKWVDSMTVEHGSYAVRFSKTGQPTQVVYIEV